MLLSDSFVHRFARPLCSSTPIAYYIYSGFASLLKGIKLSDFLSIRHDKTCMPYNLVYVIISFLSILKQVDLVIE